MGNILMNDNGKPSTAIVVAIAIAFVAVLASICILFIWGDTEHSIELIVIVVGLASTTITGLIAALGSNKNVAQTRRNTEQLQANSEKIDAVHNAVNGALTQKIQQGMSQSAKTGAQAGIDAARKAIQDAEARAYDEAYQKGLADGAKAHAPSTSVPTNRTGTKGGA